MLHADIFQYILNFIHFDDLLNALIAFKMVGRIDDYLSRCSKKTVTEFGDDYRLPNDKFYRNKLPAIHVGGILKWRYRI